MATKHSIARVARREVTADTKHRAKVAKQAAKAGLTTDSFVNFAHKMGIGADNALSTATYGFNPVTRLRTVLEWIHRGSWLGGMAVDLIADDMTKMGVELQSDLRPNQLQKVEEAAVSLGIWSRLNETIKWARLYGGAIAVMMVDGQRYETPLRLETIGKGQFKGLMVLDRWMVEPSLNDLITVAGPELGLPKFYTVATDAPALNRMKIHHSRCVRLVGIEMPYWQRIQEQLWGISVIERIYDRMIAFDSATTGAAQLVYKAYLRTYKIKGLRDIIAAGGAPLDGLVKFLEMMRRFQGIEGITLLDMEDEFAVREHGTFAGLSDALQQFGQQLSGALQIPLVRLFGQSPAGFSSGESDLRMYYDNIKQQQEKDLRVSATRIYRAISQSEGIRLPEGFRLQFRSLWQLSEKEKTEVAEGTTRAVVQAEEAGLISQQAGMKELKQSSQVTGIYSNITAEDIESAEESLPPAGEEAMKLAQEQAKLSQGEEDDDEDEPETSKKKRKTRDATAQALDAANAVYHHSIQTLTDAHNRALDAIVKVTAVPPAPVTLQSAPVNVKTDVHVPPAEKGDTNINVQPPAVVVEVPKPGDVHVHNQMNVKTFPSESTETIKRDSKGEMAEVHRKNKE
jgi:phage-related protein (TIGR01555 family)